MTHMQVFMNCQSGFLYMLSLAFIPKLLEFTNLAEFTLLLTGLISQSLTAGFEFLQTNLLK